ncbi:MAG: phosphodiester glycosidase family protein [Deltaproteobacteria bacterium]|nr:phosphodiester glycosidase family protein [Deltaproteobacteria bacterium]
MIAESSVRRCIRQLMMLCVSCTLTFASVASCAQMIHWRLLEPGLEFAEVETPVIRGIPAGTLSVIRVDPSLYELSVLSASLLGRKKNLTADRWAREYGMNVIVNAGMYQRDHATSVGHLRVGDRMNNRHRHKKHKALLVSGPRKKGLPSVALLDAECEDAWKTADDYNVVLQGIRMISCKGKNVWKPGGRSYRQVAIGMDARGRVLFVYRATPCTSHQFARQALGSGLGLKRLMYLEGGAETSLFVHSRKGDIRLGGIGALLPDLWKDGGVTTFLPLPNVIGVKKK